MKKGSFLDKDVAEQLKAKKIVAGFDEAKDIDWALDVKEGDFRLPVDDGGLVYYRGALLVEFIEETYGENKLWELYQRCCSQEARSLCDGRNDGPVLSWALEKTVGGKYSDLISNFYQYLEDKKAKIR